MLKTPMTIAFFKVNFLCLSYYFGIVLFYPKHYPCITFNEDVFDYRNRKSDSIWVQIESLLAEKMGDSPVRGNVAKRQKGCRPTLVD